MKNLRKQEQGSKGITLIALVITIIVLLILAAVSISTLTGENGILSKANTAKTETEKASAKEKVQVAVMGSFGNDGKIDNNELKTNLDNVEGIDKATVPAIITDDTYPFEVTVDGHKVTIDENRKVIIEEEEKKVEDTLISFSINDQNVTVREAIFNDEWNVDVAFPSFIPWLCEVSDFSGFTFESGSIATVMEMKHNGRYVNIQKNDINYSCTLGEYDPPQEGDKFVLTYNDTGERVLLEY